MEIIRISAAGIACVLAAIFMKTAKPEYSVYLTMAAGLFILAFAVGKFSYLYESLQKNTTICTCRYYIYEYPYENDRYHLYRSVLGRNL